MHDALCARVICSAAGDFREALSQPRPSSANARRCRRSQCIHSVHGAWCDEAHVSVPTPSA